MAQKKEEQKEKEIFLENENIGVTFRCRISRKTWMGMDNWCPLSKLPSDVLETFQRAVADELAARARIKLVMKEP